MTDQEDVLTSFVVSLVKSACRRVGDDVWDYYMSEADVSTCVAAQLREVGVTVEREHPITPTWVSEGGVDVTLHARRADLAAFHKRGSSGEVCVLVELKVGSRIDDRHRQQAAAYARFKGATAILALFKREPAKPDERVVFEIFGPKRSGSVTRGQSN